MSATTRIGSPILFVDEAPQVQLAGEMLFVELAGQRFAMTAHTIQVLMQASRRALIKREADMALVIPMPERRGTGGKAYQRKKGVR